MKRKIWIIVALVLFFCVAASIYYWFFFRKANLTGRSSSNISSNNASSIKADVSPKKGSPPEITGVAAFPSDGIGKAGLDYKELPTGSADDWGNVKIPYFNPLGSMHLYEGERVSYRENSSLKLELLDNYFTNTFSVDGEGWTMIINNPDFKIFWLRAYVKKIGGKIYNSPGDTAVFQVYENDKTQYWVKADIGDNRCVLNIIRNEVIPAGITQAFKPSDYKENSISFYTDSVKGKLQSVTVTLKGDNNSGIKLDCNGDCTYGEYTRIIRKTIGNAEQINTKKSNTFIFDDIPITEGQLKWTLNWDSLRGTIKPSEITFKIDNVADIKPVKYGEQLGMLRVVGVPLGDVEILPGDSSDNRHPDFNAGYVIGTRDKDGNSVFSVPSGYYSVRFANYSSLSINAPGLMRLVPVNAGEITTVTVPREVQLAYGQLQKQYGTFSSSAGNIEITGNKDNGSTATASIVINDPQKRDVFPKKEDITITENGLKAVVTDIKRETAPVDVVLVLDTSGSMSKDMKFAVESAKKFVSRLPDNTNIRFVQFEQKITQYDAGSKAAVIAALDKVKASGGTAMYDATDTALKLLNGKKKPYVVLFSDGADSRELKNMGKGSTLTRAQILQKISSSGSTVLTIGFGKDHDPRSLKEMSSASKDGAYFAALDPAALDQAFAAVSGKFGNQFTITYERPVAVKDKNSDVPVVSLMIDRSGSMDMDPSESKDDVGYRIDKVKNLFHDFVVKLPQGTLMQLGSFRIPPTNPDNILYDELTTDQKAPVLQGLGQFNAGGGTPIVSALTTAYNYLSTIPSSKKTLVYFTDAALAGKNESEKVQLEEILLKMKKDGFRILFAGLGNDKFSGLYNQAFSEAAAISGGEYIITSNIDDIRNKLDDLMNRINQPALDNKLLDFSISINCAAEDGSRMDYGAQKGISDFSEREKTGEVIKPELVKISTGEVYSTYNRAASTLLYGSDKPNVDSTVLEYIPYETASKGGFTAKNKEMKLTVKEAYYMNPFKGIDIISKGRQFLALNVELALNDDAQIKEYQIPSIFNHFCISLNNCVTPASQATWLAESPLSEPGNPSVSLTSKTKRSGVLVFMVDRKWGQRVDQLSLHFYDTSYGHISIPLVGGNPKNAENISSLPQATPEKLSEAFSLSVNGKNDVTELSGTAVTQETGANADKNTVFRVLEGGFQSNMQALLNIDPVQRFMYAIETDQGPLVTKMNDIVYNMPLGFTGSTMVAPAAVSPVRMPYQIPSKLAGNSSYVFADIATGAVDIKVTSGEPYKTGSLGKKWSHEYFDLTVNALRRVSVNNENTVVLDFTVTDKKDGMGLKDISGLLALGRTGSTGGDSKLSGDSAKYFGKNIAVGRNGLGNLTGTPEYGNVVPVSKDTNALLYGASTDWAVLDGATRRGILLFRLPNGTNFAQWALNCGIIENLNLPVEAAYYEHPALLAGKQIVDRDTSIENQLREAVTAAIAKYQSSRTSANTYTTLGLSPEDNVGRQSITPALTIHGRLVLESIKTDDDFLNVMYSLSCIPNGDIYSYTYSPEAVITQGWGTELDLSRLAFDILSRLGYQPRILTANLTSTGVENVKRITGLNTERKMPAIAYIDSNGKQKAFVIPFMRDISELTGLAYISVQNAYNNNFGPLQNHMTIKAHAQIIKRPGGQAQVEAFNSLNSMFGGEGGKSEDKPIYEDITLFDRDISLADMSLDSVDISYAPVGKSADGQHEIVTALIDTKQGILCNDKMFIDTSFYNVESTTVTIDIGNGKAIHTTYLQKDQKLSSVFQTLAINLPGMTKNAADTLEKAVKAKAAEGKNAGDYATVKWIGHATINRFVRGLTNFEEENMPLFGVKAARINNNPLVLMVTMVSDGKKATATVDIMHHQNKILSSPSKEKKDGFSSAEGIFVSMLEAYALGEDKAVGFLQIWTQLPENTPIFVIPTENMEEFAKSFEEYGAPPKLVERLREQAKNGIKSMFLVPRDPAVIDGKQRYAWLEMTESNNGTQIISVSETGEHSALAEYIILNAASFGVKPLSAEGVAGFLFGITCIDWGIVTYSLQTEDYASIMAQTKMLVSGVQQVLATIESATDISAKLGTMGTDAKKQLEALEASYKLLLKQNKLNVNLAKIHDASRNLVTMPTFSGSDWKKNDLAKGVKGYSFSEGFKAAIEAYFPI